MSGALERYRSLFTHNPHPVFELALDGTYRDANAACQEMLGYTIDQLRGMHYLDVVCPDRRQHARETFAEVVSGAATTVETSVRHSDGRIFDVRITVMPVLVDGELVGLHGVGEDVTEQRRRSEELEHARRLAEEANAAKSLLLANMSHELRTPLTTLLATTELLEDSSLDETQRRLVDAQRRAGQRLRRLIDDILDFSRAEAATLTLRSDPFAFRPVIDDLAGMFTGLARSKGVEFDYELDYSGPDVLVGDALRVSQVLSNVLDNAVKFTAQGRVSFKVSVPVQVTDMVWVEAEVSDTGPGIPEEFRDGLFEPFAQADPSLTRRHEGAGLGLAITAQLLELLHGTIEVDSELGRGTTVRVVLPFLVSPAHRAPSDT